MIIIVAIIGIAYGILMNEDEFVINHALIEQVNNDQDLHWTATEHAIFKGKRVRDFLQPNSKKLGMFHPDSTPEQPKTRRNRVGDIPDSFDTYTKYPQCKLPIIDQGQLGNAEDITACEAMSDRFCVKKGSLCKLSAQYIISCDPHGEMQEDAWEFLETNGTVSEGCFPMASGKIPKCPTKCVDGSPLKFDKISSFTNYATVEDAQTDMLEYGSIQAAFEIYQDFFNYESGVYEHKFGGLAGEHVIKIQGWGIDSNSKLPYWNCANSWGASWGMHGYFWIVRGKDECKIEDNMFGGVPAL